VSRKLTPQWTVGVGLSLEQETITQAQGELRYYTLLALPLTVKYDSTALTNPLNDPLHGLRVTLSLAPTESLGRPDATFVIFQATGSTYLDLARLNWTTPGRSVIALRGIAADAHGAGQFSLPPDQRFYGGGSTTVRGFSYQSIGPQFCLPTPTSTPANPCSYNQVATGGTELVAAGAEFRQRLYTNWGAAVFIDAGAVNTGEQPLKVLRCEPSFECERGLRRGRALLHTDRSGALRCGAARGAPSCRTARRSRVYVGHRAGVLDGAPATASR
jgi:translocation and assembly module TamA